MNSLLCFNSQVKERRGEKKRVQMLNKRRLRSFFFFIPVFDSSTVLCFRGHTLYFKPKTSEFSVLSRETCATAQKAAVTTLHVQKAPHPSPSSPTLCQVSEAVHSPGVTLPKVCNYKNQQRAFLSPVSQNYDKEGQIFTPLPLPSPLFLR